MNATLRHALLQAGLNEEDVAARLAVDPKTVRRWIEGRIPYLRHRWELARLLGCDETDLWPETGAGSSQPEEVLAIYPHGESMPRQVWSAMLGSAKREIGILAGDDLVLADQSLVLAVLADRARVGVRVRICIRAPEVPVPTNHSSDALVEYGTLLQRGDVQVRVHRAVLNNAMYRADDDMLVSQYVFAVPAGRSPVLHMRRTGSDDMFATYLQSFEEVWADATPHERA